MWLLRRHVSTTRPSSKLDVRRLGSFSIIEQIGASAFRLQLPSSMQIHPVFQVSLLELHVENTFPGRVVDIPLPIHVDGFPEFEVHSVLDSRFKRRKLEYLVDCIGHDASDWTWEPATNLPNAQDAIATFHIRYPSRLSPVSPAMS